MAKLNWHPPKIKPRVAQIASTAPYSAIVHEGATRKDGTKIPARPWLTTAVFQINFEKDFKNEFQSSGSTDLAFEYVANQLFEKERSLLKEDIWQFDRITRRRNNSVVGSPRDIYDLGNLYNSQELRFLR